MGARGKTLARQGFATLAVGLCGCSSSSSPSAQPLDAAISYGDDGGPVCPDEVNGRCIVTLAHEPDVPVAIAVDKENVFWASAFSMNFGNTLFGTGGIRKVPISGGLATTLASGNLPTAIALDQANVYWSDVLADDAGAPIGDAGAYTRAVFKVAATGGGATVLASGTGDPLAVDSANVYFTMADSLMRLPTSGGVATTLASAPGATSIAVDSASVYWLGQGQSTEVLKVPIAGGTVTTLASAPTSGTAGSFAIGATSAYFSCEPWGYAVTKVPLGGGAVATLASHGYAAALAADAVSVYWIDGANVMKVPLLGGAVTTLAQAPGAGAIAIDATSVYWTVNATGDIKKLTPK